MRFIRFFLPLSFALACCSPMDSFQIEGIGYTVLHSETANFSQVKNFNPIIGDYMKYHPFVDKNLTFRVAALSYATVDPKGNPVEASGLVYHPISKKSKGVIDFMPTAHIHSDGGGTDEVYIVEGLLITLGYTVIVPDLIGSGVSKDMPIPFLMAENTGRVSYDMRRAAAQYLWDEFRYVLPVETKVLGYSLGGSAALSTQKYYETHHSDKIKITEVYTGGGAYDLPSAFDAFAHSAYTVYPAVPSVIIAFNHYYNLNLDFSKIFKGELLNHYLEWYNGDYNYSAIMDWIGTDMHAYMHEDFFKPFDQQNEEFKKLYPHLIENSLSEGWRPKAPIYLIHAIDDSHVPLQNAEATVKKLRKAGANISFIAYPGDHLTVANFYFLRTLLKFS